MVNGPFFQLLIGLSVAGQARAAEPKEERPAIHQRGQGFLRFGVGGGAGYASSQLRGALVPYADVSSALGEGSLTLGGGGFAAKNVALYADFWAHGGAGSTTLYFGDEAKVSEWVGCLGIGIGIHSPSNLVFNLSVGLSLSSLSTGTSAGDTDDFGMGPGVSAFLGRQWQLKSRISLGFAVGGTYALADASREQTANENVLSTWIHSGTAVAMLTLSVN